MGTRSTTEMKIPTSTAFLTQAKPTPQEWKIPVTKTTMVFRTGKRTFPVLHGTLPIRTLAVSMTAMSEMYLTEQTHVIR